jgi:hypothetical protein
MVSRSLWGWRFCSRRCRRVYLLDKWRAVRWIDVVSAALARLTPRLRGS